MELIKQHEYHCNSNRVQVELAVFDLVGQLLAISLEKYDVEIIIEAKDFLYDQGNGFECDQELKTIIDCEEVVETEDALEITLSGIIENNTRQQETFALFFTLSLDHAVNAFWKRCKGKEPGTNSLRLQFGRKVEQFFDSVFRVKLYRKELYGQLHELGCGRGFLVFGRDKTSTTN